MKAVYVLPVYINPIPFCDDPEPFGLPLFSLYRNKSQPPLVPFLLWDLSMVQKYVARQTWKEGGVAMLGRAKAACHLLGVSSQALLVCVPFCVGERVACNCTQIGQVHWSQAVGEGAPGVIHEMQEAASAAVFSI